MIYFTFTYTCQEIGLSLLFFLSERLKLKQRLSFDHFQKIHADKKKPLNFHLVRMNLNKFFFAHN
jgi:hypothetical protein